MKYVLLAFFFLVTVLLRAYADVNADLIEAVKLDLTVKAKKLLDAGADADTKNNFNQPVLWLASNKGHAEIAKLLLDAGADPDAKASSDSVFFNAVFNGHSEILRYLIDAGVNVDSKNENGETALIEAAKRDRAEIVRVLLDAGADIHIRDEWGGTSLYEAVSGGHADIVRLLLDAGADADITVNRGYTALMAAVYENNAEILRLLIDAGADLDAQDDNGYTALYWGVNNSWYGGSCAEMMNVLLSAGADPNKKANNGWTALYQAMSWGLSEIAHLLIDAGAVYEATLNDSDVRIRTKPATAGSSVIGMLQKGDTVRILAMSRERETIGDMTAYWLKIQTAEGLIGYSYGYFFDFSEWNAGYFPRF